MWFILKNKFKFLTLMTLQLKNCYCTFTGLVMQSQYNIQWFQNKPVTAGVPPAT